jgi:hypothetical protein
LRRRFGKRLAKSRSLVRGVPGSESSQWIALTLTELRSDSQITWRAIRGDSAMGRARPKASPTDQHARRIAVAIGKGGPPVITPDLDRYLESSPHEIFAAFEGAARHMPPAGSDEALAFGYLVLLQGLLERLRYRTDAATRTPPG